MSMHNPNPDITVSITITDGDRESLELLQERHSRDDHTGILAHILGQYYDRLEAQMLETRG